MWRRASGFSPPTHKSAAFALRKRLGLPRRPAWKRDNRFLSCEPVEVPEPHPWLDIPNDVPIGKIEHVESVVRAQHFLEDECATGERLIHPLLNQPVPPKWSIPPRGGPHTSSRRRRSTT